MTVASMVAMENVCGVDVSEVTEALTSDGGSDQCLLIDCRSFLAFNKSRIAESINVHCPPILKRRSGGFIALENIVPCANKRAQLLEGSYTSVLVYDDNTQELVQAPSESTILSVISSLVKQVENLTVRFIKGGFEAMREECPILCLSQGVTYMGREKPTSSRDRVKQSQMNEPSEILPHIFLGDVSHSRQRSLLHRLGITALLNVSSSCSSNVGGEFTYKSVLVPDSMEADLFSCFPELIEFIENVRKQQGRVLVHCRAGVSRSATVCIAYIMYVQGLTLDAAYEFVKNKRPVIDPNINFIRQLQKFDQAINLQSRTQNLTSSHIQDHHHLLHPHSPLPAEPAESSQVKMDVSSPPMTPTLTSFSDSPISNPHPQVPLIAQPLSEPEQGRLTPCSLSQSAASPSPVCNNLAPVSIPGRLSPVCIPGHLSPVCIPGHLSPIFIPGPSSPLCGPSAACSPTFNSNPETASSPSPPKSPFVHSLSTAVTSVYKKPGALTTTSAYDPAPQVSSVCKTPTIRLPSACTTPGAVASQTPEYSISRPVSLPLVQVSTPSTPHHRDGPAFLFPSPVQPVAPSPHSRSSPWAQSCFFGRDFPSPIGNNVPSEAHHQDQISPRPSPFLVPEMSFPIPGSPASPLSFPLSPLPSCG